MELDIWPVSFTLPMKPSDCYRATMDGSGDVFADDNGRS